MDTYRVEEDNQFSILIGANLCETFFFGVYSSAFIFSSVFMLSKRPSTPVRNFMLAMFVVMYTVSAAHWALNMAIAVRSLRVGMVSTSPFEMLVTMCLPTINYIICDGILMWRAWVLCGRRFILFIPALFCLVCILVLSPTSAAYVYIGTDDDEGSEKDVGMSRYLGLTVGGLQIGINLWATGLICIQTWQHRQAVRSMLGMGTTTFKAERVLFFMVESGALYLCIWVLYMISSFTPWVTFFIVDAAIVQLVGIYPMTVVLLVMARLSTADVLSLSGPETYEPPISIRFSPSLSLPPIPRDVGGLVENDDDVVPHTDESSGTLVPDQSQSEK